MDILTDLIGQRRSYLGSEIPELILELLHLLALGLSLLMLRFSKLQSLFKLLKSAAENSLLAFPNRQLPVMSRRK